MNEEYLYITVLGEVKEKMPSEDRFPSKLILALENDTIEIRTIFSKREFDSINIGDKRVFYLIIKELNPVSIDAYISEAERTFAQNTYAPGFGPGNYEALFSHAADKGMSLDDICFEIAMGNTQFILDAARVGSHTAERFISTNRNKVKINRTKESENGEASALNENNAISEAKEMLKSLGFSSADIESVFQCSEIVDCSDVSEIVKQAIRKLQ